MQNHEEAAIYYEMGGWRKFLNQKMKSYVKIDMEGQKFFSKGQAHQTEQLFLFQFWNKRQPKW